ncbi:Protein LURP-one-related 8 [Acorus calamus]|uniref:Protein LURP-one-related 8 n=1 Tax=Acorus calamus TaxID=4465 RepID=A0AAV9C7N7_ACOCL|nr:Protein LURP-one-related 8 [Acorus calamus]
MTKVHPNISAESRTPPPSVAAAIGVGELETPPEVLTVWKKSLLFNCNGFTVFDAKGNLVFRVDNYVSDNRGEIVLMDSCGKPLLTFRRKKLSLGDHWVVYNGEEHSNPLFSVKKHVTFLNSKSLAHVTPCGGGASRGFFIEGSYTQRSCSVYDDSRRQVAEIRRKEATAGGVRFGVDVFRLVVRPGIDVTVAMAVVILLEQMFGSRKG